MDGEEIERKRSVKCLGVMLDDALSWKDQVESVRKKCFVGLAKLRRLKMLLSSRTKKQIYNALVLPHFDYCSVVWQEWSMELGKKLERVQNYGMTDETDSIKAIKDAPRRVARRVGLENIGEEA